MNNSKQSVAFRTIFLLSLAFSICLFSGCGDTPLPENHFGTEESSGTQMANDDRQNSEQEESSSSGNSDTPIQSAEPRFVLGEGWKRHPKRTAVQINLAEGGYLTLTQTHSENLSDGQTALQHATQILEEYQNQCSVMTPADLAFSKNEIFGCYYGYSLLSYDEDSRPFHLIKAYDGMFDVDNYLLIFEHDGRLVRFLVDGAVDNHLDDIRQMVNSYSYDESSPDTPKASEEDWKYKAEVF